MIPDFLSYAAKLYSVVRRNISSSSGVDYINFITHGIYLPLSFYLGYRAALYSVVPVGQLHLVIMKVQYIFYIGVRYAIISTSLRLPHPQYHSLVDDLSRLRLPITLSGCRTGCLKQWSCAV